MADTIPALINKVATALGNDVNINGIALTMPKVIREVLGDPCAKIARHITLPILVAELAFVGVRIAMKQAFADQFVKFTITTIIAYIILWGAPQEVIRKAMKDLREGGQAFGTEIAKKSSVPAVGSEPLQWWSNWLGDIQQPDGKYSANYILGMFDIKLKAGDNAGNSPAWKDIFDKALNFDGNIWAAIYTKFTNLPNEMKDSGTIEGLMAVVMPLVIISMILTAVMVQMAGYFAPLFVQVGILIGSEVMLEFVLAVGIVVVPLMFFKSFEDIWKKYLFFCAGMALIPCFYYILSGIGYYFSTAVFESICAAGGDHAHFPYVIKQIFFVGLKNTAPSLTGFLGAVFLSVGLEVVGYFIAAFSKLFFFVGGSVIITSFVSGGVGFATIAPTVATAWKDAFTKLEMMEKITEFFSGIQSSTASAVGQTMTKSVSTGGGMVGSAGKAVGAALK